MRTESQLVTDDAVRPAGKPGECYYCHAMLGTEHNAGCVMRKRTVVCEVKFRIVREVPEDWDVDLIEFCMNESGCCDNLVTDLRKQVARWEQQSVDNCRTCFCQGDQASGTYLREATEEDEWLAGLRESIWS